MFVFKDFILRIYYPKLYQKNVFALNSVLIDVTFVTAFRVTAI